VRWTVLLPARALPAAKRRLLPASAGHAEHLRLVEAIRTDTRSAALAADGVARVLSVVDRPGEPGAFVQRTPGLNGALREAAEYAVQHWPDDGVAALLADLPALHPAELAAALAAAARARRAFVPDAAGTGTTLLAAVPGVALEPAFGPGSAARHATGAVALDAGPGLRTDVDTAADLAEAAELGLGPATAAVLDAAGVARRSPRRAIIDT
jgi:2-phospho-L-lactate guanylyltransferase